MTYDEALLLAERLYGSDGGRRLRNGDALQGEGLDRAEGLARWRITELTANPLANWLDGQLIEVEYK